MDGQMSNMSRQKQGAAIDSMLLAKVEERFLAELVLRNTEGLEMTLQEFRPPSQTRERSFFQFG
jgi:hypothetical protein